VAENDRFEVCAVSPEAEATLEIALFSAPPPNKARS
jgi:hypothetical protein